VWTFFEGGDSTESLPYVLSRLGFNLVEGKGKGKCIAVCINTYTATGNHLTYGITQCYLSPGRGDFPVFTPVEAGTLFSDPEGMQG